MTSSHHSAKSVKESPDEGNNEVAEDKSQGSGRRSSLHSRQSSISMAAAKARAEAEAAKTRATFSRKEMQIKIERARLDAELDVLQQEKEAEAAIAKAVIMEAAATNLSSKGSLSEFESLHDMQSSNDKVTDYVEKHSQVFIRHPEEEQAPDPHVSNNRPESQNQNSVSINPQQQHPSSAPEAQSNFSRLDQTVHTYQPVNSRDGRQSVGTGTKIGTRQQANMLQHALSPPIECRCT